MNTPDCTMLVSTFLNAQPMQLVTTVVEFVVRSFTVSREVTLKSWTMTIPTNCQRQGCGVHIARSSYVFVKVHHASKITTRKRNSGDKTRTYWIIVLQSGLLEYFSMFCWIWTKVTDYIILCILTTKTWMMTVHHGCIVVNARMSWVNNCIFISKQFCNVFTVPAVIVLNCQFNSQETGGKIIVLC